MGSRTAQRANSCLLFHPFPVKCLDPAGVCGEEVNWKGGKAWTRIRSRNQTLLVPGLEASAPVTVGASSLCLSLPKPPQDGSKIPAGRLCLDAAPSREGGIPSRPCRAWPLGFGVSQSRGSREGTMRFRSSPAKCQSPRYNCRSLAEFESETWTKAPFSPPKVQSIPFVYKYPL